MADEGGFKASVLAELQERGDVIDLRPLVKEYVAGLARVHEQLRTSTKDLVDRSDAQVLELIARYRREGQENVLGLAAVHSNPKGGWYEHVNLFDDPIMRRRELVQRLRRIQYVERIYTTNEPQ